MNGGAAVARQGFKQVWIGATVWAFVFGGTAAASALSYVSSFPTLAERHQLAITTGRDSGIAVLLGPISAIGTVGGYTVYKDFVFLTTIGAIWAILAATRLLRREEEAGRWQVMLAGATRAPRATAATLSALLAGVVILFAGTSVLVMLAGRKPAVGFGVGESLLYGLSIAIVPAVFVGVGAVTSQLGRTRRLATSLGLGVFGVGFVIRMIADAGSGTRWLLWATPFGWSQLMRPFSANDLLPIVPAVASVLVLSSAAIVLSARRDVGEGLLASRDVAPPRAFGLGSSFGLALRLELGALLAWCIGAAAAAFALGTIAKVTTGSLPKSLGDTLDKFGVKGAFANQYFGVAFLLVATLVALLAAGQVGAASEEETSGRSVQVLAQPVDRAVLFAGRVALAAGAIVTAGVLTGLGAWVGAKTQGVDLRLGSMLGAGLNVVPTALVTLGVGAVVLAIAPRRAAVAVYAVVIWSLVIDLFGSLVSGLSWLERASLFHYMALAPAQNPEAANLIITTGLAIVLCATATAVFARRDVQTA